MIRLALPRLPGRMACSALAFTATLLLAACGGGPLAADGGDHGVGGGTDSVRDWADIDVLLPGVVLLLGEQHDARQHQALERDVVQTLAWQDRLAALAIEMADEGGTTVALPRDADEAAVQKALQWNERAWSWQNYGPVVMTAVRAGAPVLGVNLPRAAMRTALADVSLDAQLSPAAWSAQREAIRSGHCQLLPDAQIQPMTRMQVARDRTMGHLVAESVRPGKLVVLVTGAAHADKRLGVPQHLPSHLRVRSVRMQAGEPSSAGDTASHDVLWRTPALPPGDACAALRR